MISMWLEKLAEDGVIRPHVKEAIYNDCAAMVQSAEMMPKTASEIESLGAEMSLEKVGETLADAYFILKQAEVDGNVKPVPSKPDKGVYRVGRLEDDLKRISDNVSSRVKKSISISTAYDKRQRAAQQKQLNTVMKRLNQLSKKPSRGGPTAGQIAGQVARKMSSSRRGGLATSDLGRVVKNIGLLGSVALMGGIGTGAAKHLMNLRDRSKIEKGLKSSFDSAMKGGDPQTDLLHSNPEKARQAFDALAHFAPHVAMQPSAARSFMNKIINYDMSLQADDIKNLSEIERNLAQARGEGPAFVSGFGAGVDAFGLNRAAGETYKQAFN